MANFNKPNLYWYLYTTLDPISQNSKIFHKKLLTLTINPYICISNYITFSMNNRKILTLNEILSLYRRPTLQEMVDLSDEDYCKFLFERGVIKYIPEDYELYDYKQENNKDYNPLYDTVLLLRYGGYTDDDRELEKILWNEKPIGFSLNKSEEWKNPNIIEKGVVYVDGKGVEYNITNDNILTIYEKWLDGRYNFPDQERVYYLQEKKT